MIMEVMTSSPSVEFHFDSASTSPFISAPGSPQPFGNLFYSAPTSPSRVSAFYTEFDNFSKDIKEEVDDNDDDDDGDFEFNFGSQIDKTSSLPADELFHGGQIKPFKPPELNNFDEIVTGGETERKYKGSRSLPICRISDMLLEENGHDQKIPDSSTSTGNGQSKWGWKGYWRLKDMLLFRSASDGRVMGSKHPLKKYERLKKLSEEEVLNFPSSESMSKGDSRKGFPAMSAHEIHYTANRAASEEKKRRTFLPYKQNLLGGCLGFNPAVHDRNSGTFGLSTRG